MLCDVVVCVMWLLRRGFILQLYDHLFLNKVIRNYLDVLHFVTMELRSRDTWMFEGQRFWKAD